MKESVFAECNRNCNAFSVVKHSDHDTLCTAHCIPSAQLWQGSEYS